MYAPAPLARESLITRAAEEIRRLIRLRRLPPGAPLPPETQLSRMLGISRNSLREALRILDGLGFVEKQPGRRVVVRSATGTRPRPFDRAAFADAVPALHQARMAIEERCAALAATAATETDLAEIDSHLATFSEALKRGDVAAAAGAHEQFHVGVVAAAHNPVLSSLFAAVRVLVNEMSTHGQATFRERRQLRLHGVIVQALRARDARRAVAAVRRHFRTVAPLIEFMSRQPGGGG
jgi:GntR family transcriptional regulator, transcriptional repressor for pyruvate dehydrogenase complex